MVCVRDPSDEENTQGDALLCAEYCQFLALGPWPTSAQPATKQEPVASPTSITIGNLPHGLSENVLRQICGTFGIAYVVQYDGDNRTAEVAFTERKAAEGVVAFLEREIRREVGLVARLCQ
jgi:hypothetical protein